MRQRHSKGFRCSMQTVSWLVGAWRFTGALAPQASCCAPVLSTHSFGAQRSQFQCRSPCSGFVEAPDTPITSQGSATKVQRAASACNLRVRHEWLSARQQARLVDRGRVLKITLCGIHACQCDAIVCSSTPSLSVSLSCFLP